MEGYWVGVTEALSEERIAGLRPEGEEPGNVSG